MSGMAAEAMEHYNAVCRKCHAARSPPKAGHPTAETGCIDCHMPKRRTEDIVHIVVTDHLIQRQKPSGDLLADIPEHHEDATNSYRGEVVPFYPDRLPNTAEGRYYLALAQVRDRANLEKGLPALREGACRARLRSGRNRIWNSPRRCEPPGSPRALCSRFRIRCAAIRRTSRLCSNTRPHSRTPDNQRRRWPSPSARLRPRHADPRAWNTLGQAQLDMADFRASPRLSSSRR